MNKKIKNDANELEYMKEGLSNLQLDINKENEMLLGTHLSPEGVPVSAITVKKKENVDILENNNNNDKKLPKE